MADELAIAYEEGWESGYEEGRQEGRKKGQERVLNLIGQVASLKELENLKVMLESLHNNDSHREA
ncbi:MAG: hypothetical protein LBK61_09255 [Spirochaetaceae bacterium]|nr:hypothetical protein [Spirochaetaceae bacterium]